LLNAQTAPGRRAVVTKLDENWFPFANQQQAQKTACKVTRLRQARPLLVYRRKDESYYALASEFLVEVGGEQFHLPVADRVEGQRW
jgi:hypothetical protein